MILTMSAPLTLIVDDGFYYSEIKRKQKGLKAAKVHLNNTSSLKSERKFQNKETFCGMYCLVCKTKT